MTTPANATADRIRQVATTLANGDAAQTIELGERLLRELPGAAKADYASVAILVANAQLRLSRFDAARDVCQRGLRRQESPVLLGNLALAEMQMGMNESAVRHVDKAIRHEPNNADYYRIKAIALIQLGRVDEAQRIAEQVISPAGMTTVYQFLMGRISRLRGRLDDAVMHFERALTDQPGDPGLHFELRLVHVLRKDYPAALDVLDRLASTGHRSQRLYLERALVCEVLNRLDDAEAAIRAALEMGGDNPEAQLALANLERRRGRDETAAERLQNLDDESLPPRLRADIHYSLAEALDRLDRADEALAAFEAANRYRAASIHDLAPNRERSANLIASQKAKVASVSVSPGDDEPSPVFLVGFPRSGTTLLGQLLDNADGVHVHEEEDRLSQILVGDAPAAEARRQYLEMSRSLGAGEGDLVVDKMPINLVLVPRILEVFPAARFLLLLRDPRDACLSCFMQNFDVNDLTVNFLSMGETVDFCLDVWNCWLHFSAALGVEAHTIRYEELAERPGEVVRSVCEWLGINFDEAMLETSKRAIPGQMITTPSYRSVGSTISTDAVGRWRRYETLLADDFGRLAPMVAELGY